jgi:kynurenine formamidase
VRAARHDRIIDLSMPIEDHFRWPVERRVSGDHDRGDVFEATWLGWTVHGFTHMDSPRHCVPGGLTTDAIPLERTVGEAAAIDLTPIQWLTARRRGWWRWRNTDGPVGRGHTMLFERPLLPRVTSL